MTTPPPEARDKVKKTRDRYTLERCEYCEKKGISNPKCKAIRCYVPDEPTKDFRQKMEDKTFKGKVHIETRIEHQCGETVFIRGRI